jgi:hypothetical protein
LNATGTANASVAVEGAGTEIRTINLSSITGDGTLGISITAGSAEDIAGNLAPMATSAAIITVDNTDPVFSNVVVTPDRAVEGMLVTISFEVSEELAAEPDVTVNDHLAAPAAKTVYSYEYTVLPTDPLGPASVYIGGVDAAGNAGSVTDHVALLIVEQADLMPVGGAGLVALALAISGACSIRTLRRRRRAV